MTEPLRVAITTGDVDGIGSEVALKALLKYKVPKKIQLILFRTKKQRNLYFPLERRFSFQVHPDLTLALTAPTKGIELLIIEPKETDPVAWFESSVQAAHLKQIHGIATGPLSKETIRSLGYNDMGHTGILKRITGKDVSMGFLGEKFSLVLATDHIPLQKVSRYLTQKSLTQALASAKELRLLLPKKRQRLPFGLLGLNPHSGEKGLIGGEESLIHIPFMEALNKGHKINVIEGPLVPDAAFFEKSLARYSVLIANYHDQGLIPFKLLHGYRSGIQITLGLPFVRTSVDHGTAKDIFGKNQADGRSMLLAIKTAVHEAEKRSREKYV